MLKKVLSFTMAFVMICMLAFTINVSAADYTNGVAVSGSTATIWFKSNVSTSWVDVHYKINSGAQQNIRMTYNSGTARYEQNVTSVASGNVISYSFTYNNGTPAYDTSWFSYTVGSGSGSGSGQPTSGATFYQNIDYGGTAVSLGSGNYTLSQLNAKGIPNDWMSSLKVASGWTVEVYQNDNFGGTKWTYTANSSWVGDAVNDKMSSVKIYTGSSNPQVTKPSEVPSNIWTYAMNVDNKFGKGGDFALLLCAVIKKESSFGAGLSGSPSAGDGLMQVEPNTRNAYLSQFSSTFGRSYNHGSEQDQVCLGGLILREKISKFGSIYDGLLHYNGGDYWYPGCTDSYGRPILANVYADTVYATYKGYGGKN